MPNRYEREIEEILRNLEQPDVKPSIGQKWSERRRRPSPRPSVRQHHNPSLNLSTSEWLLIVAVITALIAGGYAYTIRPIPMPLSLLVGADIFSGILVLISLICIIMVALSQFRIGSGRRSFTRGGARVTPLRRSFLSTIKTRWNLLKLKLRYRRKNEQ